MSARPTVVILCPKEFKFTDNEATVEQPFLRDVADLSTVWLDFNAPIPDAVLNAHALILWHGPLITAEIIARMPHCRAIIRNGVGFDTVDIAAAAKAGIPVCNVPDYGTEEVADHAIALTLALYRQLFPLDAEAKQLGWKITVAAKMRRLSTQTFGIVGLGRIGTATALRAKALGFKVVFYDPYVPSGTHKAVGIERVGSLDELLRRAEYGFDSLPAHGRNPRPDRRAGDRVAEAGLVPREHGSRRHCAEGAGVRRAALRSSRRRRARCCRGGTAAHERRSRDAEPNIVTCSCSRSAARRVWSRCAAPRRGSRGRPCAASRCGTG